VATSAEQYRQLREVFRVVIEHEPEQRAAYLDQACVGDPALRAEIESLLASHDAAENFIEAPAFGRPLQGIAEQDGDRIEGRRLGSYQLIHEIGRGGMGTVYLAQRADEQYQKLVAIKVVRRGLDTEDILRRFRNERQILASLEHPNIARLIDGGTTDDGLPYLVVEYVEGTRVTDYCDDHQLPTNERLRMFRTICAAVQHSHQNLVVHRDLKPSNILIMADGTPKLLDFGIAKLLDPETTEKSEHTVTVLGVMTPEYASPEQVRGEQVTTASDVYSLGVLLYELLSGQRPYRITSRRPDEIARVICEVEPEKPSTAGRRQPADGLQSEPPAVAGGSYSRGLNPPATAGGSDLKSLRGDLDNIVLMAMRKEPARRYASVEQFSEDIRRHLAGLPVIARKDTFGYRTSKFVTRHKIGVVAATLVALSLIAGVATTLWQSSVARRQARIAAAERDKARMETAKSDRINSFLQEMLGFSDPSWNSPNANPGHELSVREALDEAAKRAESELADQPEVLAEVERTMGNSYRGQGRLDNAESHLRSALELYRRTRGEGSRQVAITAMNLGYVFSLRGQADAAEPLLQEALSIYRRQLSAEETVDRLSFVETLGIIGNIKRLKGDTAAAEAFYQEALQHANKLVGKDRIMIPTISVNIGATREDRGDLDGAQALYRSALEEWRRLLGEQHLETAICLRSLAINLKTKRELAESEHRFHEALDIFQRLNIDEGPFATVTAVEFADLLYLKREYTAAEKEVRRVLEIQQRTLPKDSPYFATSWTVLGKILTQTGRAVEAERYLRDALALRTRTVKNGHWSIATTEGALGECLIARKRYAEAEPLLLRGYTGMKGRLGEKDPRTIEALKRLVTLYRDWKKPDKAAQFSAMRSQ